MTESTPHQTVRPRSDWPAGSVTYLHHDSGVLKDNPWGDPSSRQLAVYQAPGMGPDDGPVPIIWHLAAYTNSGPGQLNWRNHGENLPQRLDRLIHENKMGPVRVVLPDCYTSLGGNQYLNSSAVGRYQDYLLAELLPLMGERFNCGRHGLAGKSSGGYGALVLGMKFPDQFHAIACHAGDMAFDLVYRPDFPLACLTLAQHDYDLHAFMHAFWRHKRPSGAAFHTMMILGLAASYDPDPGLESGFTLPFDLRSCVLDKVRWARWLEHDPLQLVERYAGQLKRLRGIYFDVGNRDQYQLQFGARQFHSKLQGLGIVHRFEEFEGTHSGIDHRLDESLPFLYQALINSG